MTPPRPFSGTGRRLSEEEPPRDEPPPFVPEVSSDVQVEGMPNHYQVISVDGDRVEIDIPRQEWGNYFQGPWAGARSLIVPLNRVRPYVDSDDDSDDES